jgi:hypothetical protein
LSFGPIAACTGSGNAAQAAVAALAWRNRRRSDVRIVTSLCPLLMVAPTSLRGGESLHVRGERRHLPRRPVPNATSTENVPTGAMLRVVIPGARMRRFLKAFVLACAAGLASCVVTSHAVNPQPWRISPTPFASGSSPAPW